MKSNLDVAVGIADAINHARAVDEPLDVEAQTKALASNLNVPDVTAQLIADVLRSEGRAAGVTIAKAF